MLSIADFLTRIIDDGIAAAKADYGKPDPLSQSKLKGAVEGFDACRGKTPQEIATLLAEARQASSRLAMQSSSKDDDLASYWEARCREAEIEWVANCLSAALENSGFKGIVPVTARGLMKAADVLGVAGGDGGGGDIRSKFINRHVS